jgi:hypothetical protein
MRRWLRDPLVQFLTLGAALFAIHSRFGAAPAGDGTVVVTKGRIESLAEAFARQRSRDPSDDELAGIVREYVREEVLAREAKRLGLDQDDTVIRRRLAQKMEFASAEASAFVAPTNDELRAYLAANPDRFRVDSRVSFEQVFLDRSKRGASFDRDVDRLLSELNAPGAAVDLDRIGDGKLLEPRYQSVSRGDVEAEFGPAFAARLDGLPLGRFEGPIESGYGAHLVRVDGRVAGRLAPLDEVREAVAREWSAAKRADLQEARMRETMARYRVEIDDQPGARPPDEPQRIAGVR